MKRCAIFILAAFFVALLALAPACAQRAGSASVDPNSFDLIHSGPLINQDTKPFTLRAQQTPDTTIRNLMMVILPAQSNCTSVAPTTYTPAHASAVDQMSLTTGGIYSAVDPLLNLTGVGGMPMLRLADNLITANLFDRVVLFDVAAGGTSISDWDTGIESTKLSAVVSRLKAKGWLGGITNVTTIFVGCQGEQDTNLGTLRAAYTASQNSIISKSRALGFAGTWFIPQAESWYMGAAGAEVVAGQAAVINHGSGVWEGPNLDALVGTACGGLACRQADNLHFSDAGASSMATAWQTAMHAFGAPF
jgi:hypothetical protein